MSTPAAGGPAVTPTPVPAPQATADPPAGSGTSPERDPAPEGPVSSPSLPSTRLSATWTGVVAAIILLVVLIVFISENTQHSNVSFFGLHGSAPVAVLLLIAAVAGALVVVAVAMARLLQLRHAARRGSRSANVGTAADPGSAPDALGPHRRGNTP